jgi:hypothetical protein
MPKGSYITPEILHDAPLEKGDNFDFHFDDYASTLSRLIASKKTKTPLAICVSGAWGAGKTTLLQRIKMMLDGTSVLRDHSAPELLEFVNPDESPRENFRFCRTVWFNAWKYSDEDELLVALIRRILQEMSEDSFVTDVMGKLLDPTYPRRDVVRTVLSWFKISLPGVEIGLNTGEPTQTQISEKTAILDLFDDAFNQLIAAWIHKQLNIKKTNPQEGVLVIFIDDLDRCLPEKMVQVLEAVKLFLDKKGCVFILGADVSIVQQAIIKNYQDAGVTGDSAKDYLDKIIQLRFELPPIVETRMEGYLNSAGAIGQDWGDSWKLLVTGASMNPRSVKSFVNDVNLQWSMLVNLLSETKEINRADFNAWQVLMRIAPLNFVKHIRFILYNPTHKHEYVLNAIRWARGDKSQDTDYESYQDDFRFKRVLGEISFSTSFSPNVLDSFLHLVAPPLMSEYRKNALYEPKLLSDNRLQIFVSFSIEDKVAVDEIVSRLRDDGADVWLDTERLGAGEDWEQIERALHNSHVVLACESTASQKVGYWNRQMRIAKDVSYEREEGSIYIIPLRFDDCKRSIVTRGFQHIDMFGDKKEDSYINLIKALNMVTRRHSLEKLKEPQVLAKIAAPDTNESAEFKKVFEEIFVELGNNKPSQSKVKKPTKSTTKGKTKKAKNKPSRSSTINKKKVSYKK